MCHWCWWSWGCDVSIIEHILRVFGCALITWVTTSTWFSFFHPRMFQVNKNRGEIVSNKHHIRDEKLKREKCACGDVLCNGITKFLNTSKWSKCWYKRPKSFGDKFPHKRRRSELIHNQFMLWRKKVSKNPSYEIFNNEINNVLCLMHDVIIGLLSIFWKDSK